MAKNKNNFLGIASVFVKWPRRSTFFYWILHVLSNYDLHLSFYNNEKLLNDGILEHQQQDLLKGEVGIRKSLFSCIATAWSGDKNFCFEI